MMDLEVSCFPLCWAQTFLEGVREKEGNAGSRAHKRIRGSLDLRMMDRFIWHLRNEVSQPPSALGSTRCLTSKSMTTPDGQAALWGAVCCERVSVSNRS